MNKPLIRLALMLAVGTSPTHAEQLNTTLLEAAVHAMYYETNCKPGTLSLFSIKFMAEAIKHYPQSNVDEVVQGIKKGEINWGSRAAFCTALQNNEARTGVLHKLDEAIQDLPRE
jgi:hypothetical protein